MNDKILRIFKTGFSFGRIEVSDNSAFAFGTRQAKSYWNEKFDKRVSPLGKNYYWLTGNFVNLDDGQDTDHWALENDYISVVPIQFDLTAHSYLKNLKSWNFE